MTSDCMSRRISFQFGLVRKKIPIPRNSFQIIFKIALSNLMEAKHCPYSNTDRDLALRFGLVRICPAFRNLFLGTLNRFS